MTAAAIPMPAASLAPGSDVRPAVVLEGLTKRFPVRRGWRDALRHPFARSSTAALQDVTCAVAQGEFFGLLGPNGAGKTTLFKTLATLVLPDEGRAEVLGLDVVREPAAVRRVLAPVIADERSLFWRLSAQENLEAFGGLQGLGRREAATRAAQLLEVVELADAARKMVGQFSSGMKQRLLIARALLAQPRVLLLDEPTRSLDPVSARAFRAFLREEISGRQRCTVLLATHNHEEALELCDRVAVLDRGRLLAVGTTAQLAREFGDERYRVWTRDPSHPAFASVAERALARGVHAVGADDDGWTGVEMEVPGGGEAAAQLLAFLAAQGVSVCRFERSEPSLADLIERVVAHRRAGARDA